MATGRGIRAEHGLSFWIQAGDRHVLFDCGQSDLLLHNAAILGLEWGRLGAIALSHGHYDHTGGLNTVVEQARVPVYAHPDAWGPRYARGRGRLSAIGCPFSREAIARQTQIIESRFPQALGGGITLSGEIPRLSEFESIGREFYLDLPGRPKDPIQDDQAIFLETEKGLVILLGCAHSGVINTLTHARSLFPDSPIRAVIGGMHLIGANESRIAETIRHLQGIPQVLAGHCTGWRACHALQEALGDGFAILHAGKTINLS